MNAALQYSVTCAEDVPRVSTRAMRAARQGVRSRRWPERVARSMRRLAERHGAGRCGHAGAKRHPRADPLRRARSGHAARQRRRGREDPPAQPPCRRDRLRPHRLVARLRTAAHRGVHRRSDVREASRRRASCTSKSSVAPGAVARSARGAPMIEIDGLAKAFGRRGEVKAVAGVSFTAPDGEITGLLGPNGAGKTTLLRMLATLMVPDAGARDDRRPRRRRATARRAAAHRRALRRARPLSAAHRRARTSATTARCTASPAAALDARIDELVAVLGIADIADRRAQGYLAGRADEGRDRARARPRPAHAPARRADQRARHHEHARAARAPATPARPGASACSSART